MDGSAQMNGQNPTWNTAALRPVHEKTIIEESKHKSAQWAGLHAVFLAVMEDLSNGKASVFAFLLIHEQ